MYKTSDFDYFLPENLIAQTPLKERDSSKLLVYDRTSGKTEHKIFKDILNIFKSGDVLVLNKTKVLPARIFGASSSGGKLEILLLKRLNLTDWQVLVKPGKRAQIGAQFTINDKLSAIILEKTDDGGRIVCFTFDGVFEEILSSVGEMPLPPYIKEKLADSARYQTVYGREDGSSAAPTAGLHFTESLLASLKEKGVIIAEVLLHVGLGTFRPVKAENITEHKMHGEYFEIDQKTADLINAAKSEKRRIIAVGTTSVRVLESVSGSDGYLKAKNGETDIFIYPPYKFKCVDALLTNFHLPQSTLLMLVSALVGRDKVLQLYNTAVENEYRFFSFGDAMLIL